MPRATKEKGELNKVTAKKNTKTTKTTKSTKTASKAISKKVVSKSSSKISSKKSPSKNIVENKDKFVDVLEYYDLPFRYNDTVVKILSQTPKNLFVYWDISDKDRKSLIKTYGKDFFENTFPVLIIHNKTDNYLFEIEINDFANSWYFKVEHENCEYFVELGRKFKQGFKNILDDLNNYLYITSSNSICSPNDHILFEKAQKYLNFRNIKTNEIIIKDLSSLESIKKFGKIYNIYDLYHKIYKSENILDLNNPSSSNPTSTF